MYIYVIIDSLLFLSLFIPFAVSFPKLYAAYGRGSGPIHMTVISCTGSESRLIDCRFSPNTRGDSHVEDAGVACYNGTTSEIDDK